MGNISPLKILIVAVIALVVLGPEKLPEMTRRAGKAWGDFRHFRETMESQVREVIGDVPGLGDLRGMTNTGIRSTVSSAVQGVVSPSPAQRLSEAAGPISPAGADQVQTGSDQVQARGDPTQGNAWSPPRPSPGPLGPSRASPEPVFPADDPGLN